MVKSCADTTCSEPIAFPLIPSEYVKSIPMLALLIVLISLDLGGLFRRQGLWSVDHMGHLGGYVSGIMAAEILKQRGFQVQGGNWRGRWKKDDP